MAVRAGLLLAAAAAVGVGARQLPPAAAPAKPDTPAITAMIGQVRQTAGERIDSGVSAVLRYPSEEGEW